MQSEWKRVNIASVCDLIVDCVNKTAPHVEYATPYRMIRTPNIHHGRIDLSSCRFVKKEIYEKWTRRAKVLRGDVLLTREAPMGRIGYIDFDDNVFLGQRIMQYRATNTLLDSKFLLYTFLSADLQNQFKMHDGTGTVVSHIRVADCSKFELNLPPLPTQKKIAHILSTLDDKIELNSKMNETLEAMAQALFKSWFVNFDPVHVKVNAAGREDALGYRADAKSDEALEGATAELGLSKEVLELFPSEFVESELGMIPKGWESNIGESPIQIIDGDRGSNYPKTNNFYDNEYCLFLNAKNVKKNGLNFEVCSFITKDRDELLRKGKLSRDDIVLTTRGTVGNIGYYHDLIPFENVRINSGMVILRCNTDILSPLFLYIYMKSSNFKNSVIHQTSGTAQPQLPIKDLRKVSFILPSKMIHDEFIDIISPLYLRIFNNDVEINTLKKIRDTLLPKLLSGELDVSELEVN